MSGPQRATGGAGSIDPEWVAFATGLKPTFRVTVEPAGAEAAAARFAAMGARVVRSEADAVLGGRAMAVLYLARSEADARALRDAEAPVLPGRAGGAGGGPEPVRAHLEVGRRLGFPRCCVEAFCARVERGVGRLPAGSAGAAGDWAEDYVAARSAWVARPDPLLNNLLFAARVRLVSFYPCGYACAMAGRYASAVLDAVAKRDAGAAVALRAALARPVAIGPRNARAVVELSADGRAVVGADAPRGPGESVLDARDVALAAALAGGQVASDGAVVGSGSASEPPVWIVPFGR